MTNDTGSRSDRRQHPVTDAHIVPPTVLQLKRLTRDLQQRITEFGALMELARQHATPPEREALLALLGDVEQMRQQMYHAGEIAQASMAAIARQNPVELIALRDQLTGYMAQLSSVPTPNHPSPDHTLNGDAGHK